VAGGFNDFVDSMDENRGLLQTVNDATVGLSESFKNLGSNLNQTFSLNLGLNFKGDLQKVAEDVGATATLAALGFKFGGPTGAVVGTAVGTGSSKVSQASQEEGLAQGAARFGMSDTIGLAQGGRNFLIDQFPNREEQVRNSYQTFFGWVNENNGENTKRKQMRYSNSTRGDGS
jgi:hypothetical protein